MHRAAAWRAQIVSPESALPAHEVHPLPPGAAAAAAPSPTPSPTIRAASRHALLPSANTKAENCEQLQPSSPNIRAASRHAPNRNLYRSPMDRHAVPPSAKSNAADVSGLHQQGQSSPDRPVRVQPAMQQQEQSTSSASMVGKMGQAYLESAECA